MVNSLADYVKNKRRKVWRNAHYLPTFALPGWVAEGLGSGLQNLLRRFESAPNL